MQKSYGISPKKCARFRQPFPLNETVGISRLRHLPPPKLHDALETAPSTANPSLMTRILLEFIGGAWDGMNLCNDSPDPVEVGLARQTHSLLGDGMVGQTVVMPSDYAVRPGGGGGCKYVVANRTEFGDEILVRLEVCGKEQSEPCVCAAKRLLLKFEGGYLHGRCLDSESPDTHEALLAVSYYCVTEHGTVGTAFDGIPAPSLFPIRATAPDVSRFEKGYEYRVVQRLEDDERVRVKFEYRARGGGRET